ncbi:hypothetical protein HDA40_006770 [Hamadaea flava]|uniref:CPBP family intramembrane glutamic endopeptidase n=1 Tax=Hamadaea flava TaxID=1742688 RepID=A0ABV8LT24_9ACTN|nr:type II CAAX endopeptidase family protein [Hamadaea flava]MCP2328263.1 hypothetical protein [Hamadaea flava]
MLLKTLGKALGFLVLSVASVVLAAMLVGMFAPAWASRDGQPWPVMTVGALLILGVTALCLRLERRGWATAGLRPGWAWLRQLAIGLCSGAALVGGLAWLLMLGGVLYWQPNRPFTMALMLSGTTYFVFAVLVEELVFRGYALRRLAEGIGKTKAIVVMAALFGGYHVLSIGSSLSVKSGGSELVWTAVGPLVGAIVFGVAALRTGGIALPLGLHLGWNWMQWQFFTFPGDDNPIGLWNPIVTAHYADNPAVFRLGYLVAMTVALLVVLAITRKKQGLRAPTLRVASL